METKRALDRFSDEVESILELLNLELAGDVLLSEVDRLLNELYADREGLEELRKVVRVEALTASFYHLQNALPSREEFDHEMAQLTEDARSFFKKMLESQGVSRARLKIAFGEIKAKA